MFNADTYCPLKEIMERCGVHFDEFIGSKGDMTTSQNTSHKALLIGSWDKRDSFQLGIGVNAMVNSVERYTFREDGTGTYSYEDDSELPAKDAYSEFEFNVDHNRIVLLSSGSFNDSVAIDFRLDGNELTLDYDGFEEVYIKTAPEMTNV